MTYPNGQSRTWCASHTPSLERLEERLLLSLVGLQPDYPIMPYNATGVLNYDAGAQELVIDASPLAMRFSPTAARPIQTPRDFRIDVLVDGAGALIGGSAGDDLVVEGVLDADGDGTADYSGVLLTGEVLEFGFLDSGTTDQYEFRFRPTGGALADLYAGRDIAVQVTSANSTFTGSFAVDFAGKAQGTLGSTAPLPAALGDRVWQDLDYDGVQAAYEPGVAGVTVQLLDDAGAVQASALTDADGFYRFDGLAPGTYSVRFVLPDGYAFTTPDQGDDALDSDAFPLDGQSGPVTLVSGQEDLTVDAGVVAVMPLANAALGDSVWLDVDGDGVQDAGELGVAGVTVRLYDEAGVEIASAVTNADGGYRFEELQAGSYSVGFEAPSGYALTGADRGGDDALDSDANPATGRTGAVALEPGDEDLTLDAGLVLNATGEGFGCTPGFWKQKQHLAYWTGFDPSMKFADVFGVSPRKDWTLLEALGVGGGGENALARHAVAALLNAASPRVDYLYTQEQIILMVRTAFLTGHFETVKDGLMVQNETGCEDIKDDKAFATAIPDAQAPAPAPVTGNGNAKGKKDKKK